MSPFETILVPLDGSPAAARSLGCASWLGRRLGARLHVLSATSDHLPPAQELARLGVSEECISQVVLHRADAPPQQAILRVLACHRAGLAVVSARGQSEQEDPAPFLGHVAREVLEGSSAPVLLLPPAYRECLPWQRLLAPVSGEADEALSLALRLGGALDLEVHVAHVADPASAGLEAETRYADALHHEYPGRLRELLDRSLSGAAPSRASALILSLSAGEVASELLELIERTRPSLLVVGWHGRLAGGSARVLKRLIAALSIPVLLVKPPARMGFRLKVGEEFD